MREAGKGARKCPSRQISRRMGVELGSASQPVKIEVGGEDLPRPAIFFADRAVLRGLLLQIFRPRPAIWRLFCGPGRFAGSARVALMRGIRVCDGYLLCLDLCVDSPATAPEILLATY